MSKPILYKANETNFRTLGLGVLSDATEALAIEERNGQFYLTMKYPIDGINFNELKNDRIIKANASHDLKDQRFKIIRITKPAKGLVTVYAEHVSNHTAGLPLAPNVSYSGTAEQALNVWSKNIVDDHPFTVYSDITTTGSGTWELYEVENARRALGGVRGSILDTYGGEYRFDNYHIMLLAQRGDDNGIPIMYGKNLIDLEQEEEIANTYTSIMPYAYYQPEGAEEPIEITLPEYYIDSEHVDKYARRKILKVNFTADEIETVAQLRTRTQRYITENNVGVPKVNLRVKFVDLAKTLDYKHLDLVEEINLCDWVVVRFEKLGIKQRAKIIKTTWNVLLDRYEEIEIGEVRASLSDSIGTVVDGKIEQVDNRINRVQIAANGKNRVFRGPDEPQSGMSQNDLWYKPVGDGEVEMYRYDGASWRIEKVSAGLVAGTLDAGSGDLDIINMNANNITANRGNFVSLALNELNSSLHVTGNMARYVHSDGSETRFSAGGMFHREGGTNYSTHYLMEVGTKVVDSQGGPTTSGELVTLPSVFRGKQFKVILGVADVLSYQEADYNSLAMQRLVAIIVPNSINHSNGTFRVYGYARMINVNNGNTKYVPVQLHYTAIV